MQVLVALVVIVAALIIFLTELTSTLATTATLLPVLAALAIELGISPITLTVPVALADLSLGLTVDTVAPAPPQGLAGVVEGDGAHVVGGGHVTGIVEGRRLRSQDDLAAGP